jgi:acyl-coenzyme A synthetase/AMP-(fatty) acid ligase/acyl carrier protein
MSNMQESIAHLSSELPQAAPYKSMAQLLRDLAIQSPGAIAIVDSNVKLTYQQLHQQAGLIALRLREYGIRAEDVVGVFLNRSANQVVAMLGILKTGAACLPLDTSEPPLRLKSILQDINPRLLITDHSLKAHLQDTPADLLYIEDLQQMLEESQSTERHVEDAEFYSDNLALLLYQSSPIGRAEAVMLTHRSLSDLASVAQLQVLPTDKMSYISPLWQQSWLLEVFAPLVAGATVVVLPGSSSLPPRKFASLLRDSRITILSTHSAALQRLTKEFPWAINSVRMFVCNDLPQDSPGLIARLKADILQRVFICYEAVEAAGCWALHPLSQPTTDISPQHLTTGRKLFLLDDSYEPVASDITGELYIWTDAMARGYYRNPSRTAETFIPDPFSSHASTRLYRTGELARRTPDGSVQRLGRRDWRIHHHGQMFHPQEIEAALLQHCSISQAAVVFKDGFIAAFIVAAQGQHPSSDELRLLLKQSIPETMLPSSFTFQEDLPRTPDGKLDRKALVSPDAAALCQTARPAASYVAPSNDLERQLAQIWVEVFEVQEPGIHDNFFSMGGQSMLATQVVARISDMFKLHLPLKQLFETPTIAGLAKVIEQLSPAQGIQDGNNEDKDKPHTIATERPGSCGAH